MQYDPNAEVKTTVSEVEQTPQTLAQVVNPNQQTQTQAQQTKEDELGKTEVLDLGSLT